ncbi:MAG: polyprenyl synthetase family protein [Myxococcota bacterium]
MFDRISEPLSLVERALREQIISDAELVSILGEHVLAAGGKRLRPALLLLAAELCGYTGPRRIGIAAAIELLHTATLIHDDVVDMSNLRRGRPSVNSVWGNRRAVLAGDFLYARASCMVLEDGDAEILEMFALSIQRMAEGELLQLQRSFEIGLTEAEYFDIIERKSAVLLAGTCEAGAILGGVTRAESRRLAAYGRYLGLAFQLKDDALDYDGVPAVLGKLRYADLKEGKVTLPLLLALKRCSATEREMVASLLKRAATAEGMFSEVDDDPLGKEEVAEIVSRYRGVEDTLRRADEYVARASEAIAVFPDGPAKQALVAAAAFAIARDR